jgi:hypothetical protein
MSLVNLTPATTTAVLDPVLYDSGWKQVKGQGAHFEVEILKDLDADAIVYVYAKKFYTTLFEDWKVQINYREPDSFATNTDWGWRRTYDRARAADKGGSTFFNNVTYEAFPNITQMTTTSSVNPLIHNSTGFDLMKCVFTHRIRLLPQMVLSIDLLQYEVMA